MPSVPDKILNAFTTNTDGAEYDFPGGILTVTADSGSNFDGATVGIKYKPSLATNFTPVGDLTFVAAGVKNIILSPGKIKGYASGGGGAMSITLFVT